MLSKKILNDLGEMLAIREISAVITAVAFIEYIYCIQRHSSNNTPQPPPPPGGCLCHHVTYDTRTILYITRCENENLQPLFIFPRQYIA